KAVGAEVSAGEWVAAGMDVATVAGPLFKLGKMGIAVLERQALQSAERQAVIAEARSTIGRAAAEAQEAIGTAGKRIAADKQLYAQSRLIAELRSPAGLPSAESAFGEAGYANTFLSDTKIKPFPEPALLKEPLRVPIPGADEAGQMAKIGCFVAGTLIST